MTREQSRSSRNSGFVGPEILVFVVAALVSRADLAAAPKSQCPPPGVASGKDCILPVTTIIGDTDTHGLTPDIASDLKGPYRDGVDGVFSQLISSYGLNYGEWHFDVYSSTTRTVNHTFDSNDAVQPGDPHYTAPANPPFWGTQSLLSHLEVKCQFLGNDMVTMSAGSSFTCPMINRFNAAGVDYRFDPDYSFSLYPEVTDVQITCDGVGADGFCSDWFIDPIGLSQAVGRVVPVAQNQGHQPVNDGDFYMRFHIHITRP